MRVLWRSPRFAIPTVLALAVAMGATLAVFTVVHSVLLAQLPLSRPEELVAVWSMRPDGAPYPFNIANYLDLRERNGVMQDMAAYGNVNMNLTGEANPERINGVRATGNF